VERVATAVQPEARVEVPAGAVTLAGSLRPAVDPVAVVGVAAVGACAHHGVATVQLCEALARNRLSTLAIDLLAEREEEGDRFSGRLRFDIDLLADRLEAVAVWLAGHPASAGLPFGVLAGGTASAAALVLAARRPDLVRAVVCRGGRADLAGAALDHVAAPTLLLAGEQDEPVRDLSFATLARLRNAPAALQVVPEGDSALDSGPALAAVAGLAAGWFVQRIAASPVNS
jgi:dienelactone hydrolase